MFSQNFMDDLISPLKGGGALLYLLYFLFIPVDFFTVIRSTKVASQWVYSFYFVRRSLKVSFFIIISKHKGPDPAW